MFKTKQLLILAVTKIHVWYGECSRVNLFDVDDFCVKNGEWGRLLKWGRLLEWGSLLE